jgi:ABC-2 type transport system ATP-binding protein
MKDLIIKLRDQGKTVLMCSHRLDDVQDVCDRIAILHDGELQELGKVSRLLQVASRVEIQASGVKPTDELRRDLEALFAKHGGRLEMFGHPTTTLEDLFLRIVEESKAHPGRRYLPGKEGEEQAPPAPAPAPQGEAETQIKKG